MCEISNFIEGGDEFIIGRSVEGGTIDMGALVDDTALLDNFRWDCEGCVPSEVDDCGVMPPM